jgi:hypothetical protein
MNEGAAPMMIRKDCAARASKADGIIIGRDNLRRVRRKLEFKYKQTKKFKVKMESPGMVFRPILANAFF